jgi:hypothetical protein
MACRTFLAGGEANTDPATAALSMPPPTNPVKRNTNWYKICLYFMHFIIPSLVTTTEDLFDRKVAAPV